MFWSANSIADLSHFQIFSGISWPSSLSVIPCYWNSLTNSDHYKIEISLAVTLSLAQYDDGSSDHNMNHNGQEYGSDLSYESITQLENVMCIALVVVVSSLSVNAFVEKKPASRRNSSHNSHNRVKTYMW